MKKLLSTFNFPLVLLLFAMTFGSSMQAQCLVEGNNIIYTPNPSNTVVNNGTEWVKLYIHVIEDNPSVPSVSDLEINNLINQVNTDFSNANIQFFYCLDRNYILGACGDLNVGSIYGVADNKDGIDVYLLPPSCVRPRNPSDIFSCDLYAGGYSFNSNSSTTTVPGENVLIFGKTTLCEFPYFPAGVRFYLAPHVLSHELGHCLGLLHTHETFFCTEPPIGGDCLNCGDMVCDTKPADNLRYAVNQSCHRVNANFVCDGTPTGACNGEYIVPSNGYDPDLNNIMAYTNYFNCSPIFTDGQNQRMRETLQNNSLLQSFRHKIIQGDLVINSWVDWPYASLPPSGNLVINGNLIMEPGSYLTITKGSISFPNNGSVIIKNSARLEIENCTLTSNCDYWQGVRIQGTPTAPQNTSTHGQLRCLEGSVIKNAVIGAHAKDGGIFRSYKAAFLDNEIGVWIDQYPFPHPNDYVELTTFNTSEFNRKKPLTNIPMLPAHLVLSGTKYAPGQRYEVRGCTFSNSSSHPINGFPNLIPFGIIGIQSDFRVTSESLPDGSEVASNFYNLSYGVIVNETNSHLFYIHKSNFTNCDIGIYSSAAKGIGVSQNHFNMDFRSTVPFFPITNTVGVWIDGGMPFTYAGIRNNFFQKVNNYFTIPIGTLAANLNDFNHQIYKNTYTNVDYANLANGNNGVKSGLHYLCNINSGNKKYDFSLAQGATVRVDQGLTNPGTNTFYPASNIFSYSNGNNGDFSDFLNAGTGTIRYYWQDVGNQEPLDYQNLQSIEVFSPFSCPDSDSDCEDVRCKTDREIVELKNEYYTKKAVLQQVDAQLAGVLQTGNQPAIIEKERESASVRAQMDEIVETVLNDEHLSYQRADTIRRWLTNLDRPDAEIFAARHYFDDNKYIQADSVAQLIPQKYAMNTESLTDLQDFRNIMSLLQSKNVFKLDTPTILALMPYTEKVSSHTAGWAKSILLYYGYWFQPQYELPEDTNERVFQGEKSNLVEFSPHLYPNPATNTLYIQLIDVGSTGRVRMYNQLGILMGEYPIGASETVKQLDLSGFISGLYFLEAERGGKRLFTERFVVQK